MNQFTTSSMKVYEWWLGLPWYWKIIGCLALVLALLLTLLGFLSGTDDGVETGKADEAQDHTVDDAVNREKTEEKERAKAIEDKKAEVTELLKKKEELELHTEDVKKAIDNASSIAEIEAILKRNGL